MRECIVKVYKFDELSDDAKEKARDWFREAAFGDEWWDAIYMDAENVGLKLTSFDLDRNRHAKGHFIAGAVECAHKIEKEHGDMCETFKTAKAFLKGRDEIVNTWPREVPGGDLEDVHELDYKLDDCEAEFLKSILEDYAMMLQEEADHQSSDEYVDEGITANDYEFTADGKRARC